MNREFLKKLGLEEEAINTIMAEHGKTVQSQKTAIAEKDTELTSLKEQLKQRDADIEELQKAATDDELKEKYSSLQEKYEADVEKLNNQLYKSRLNSAIELELTKRNARNIKTVTPLLDTEIIKLTDDGIQGLSEQLDKIAKDNPFLFATEDSGEPDSEKKPQFVNPKNPGKQNPTRTDKLREALGIKTIEGE